MITINKVPSVINSSIQSAQKVLTSSEKPLIPIDTKASSILDNYGRAMVSLADDKVQAEIEDFAQSLLVCANEKKIAKGLLDKTTYGYIREFVPERERCTSDALKFLDVIKRRSHDRKSIAYILDNYSDIKKFDERALWALEFKDFEKAKGITLDNFDQLSLKEKKDFVNGIISIGFSGAEKATQKLPDFKIFEPIKALKYPTLDMSQGSEVYRVQRDKLTLVNQKARDLYSEIIDSLLEKMPRGKEAIPNTPLKINDGCILDIKPPLTNAVSSIPTVQKTVNGVDVRIGEIPSESRFMVHNMAEDNLLRLEGLLLTDENAVLCCGYLGGMGYLKGNNRIGIIISPKKMTDLLVQARNDVSSGYGAIKNLNNIQNTFLQADNPANNYVPNLIREELNIGQDEYLDRIARLGDIHHLEEIESLDKELFDAINSVTSKNRLFEGIMRPNIEGIYLPEGKEITPAIANFANRYNIPILFKK